MAKLTMAERRKLPKSDFAVPSKAPGPGSYPIEDAAHRKAAGMLSAGKPVAGKVKAAIAKKTGRKHMEIEETDNGGYVSKTTHIMPRKPGDDYRPNPVSTAQHGSLRSLNGHIRKTFGSKPVASPKPGGGSEWSSVASKMLGGGY